MLGLVAFTHAISNTISRATGKTKSEELPQAFTDLAQTEPWPPSVQFPDSGGTIPSSARIKMPTGPSRPANQKRQKCHPAVAITA